MAERHEKIKEFMDPETGEMIPFAMKEQKVTDRDFHKTWLKGVLDSLDIVSNKKTKVAYWLIDNMDRNNQIPFTYRQISDKSGISYKTVSDTINALKDADFLRYYGKILIINPNYIFKGTAGRRLGVAELYEKADAPNETAEEKIASLTASLEKLQKQEKKISEQIDSLRLASQMSQNIATQEENKAEYIQLDLNGTEHKMNPNGNEVTDR